MAYRARRPVAPRIGGRGRRDGRATLAGDGVLVANRWCAATPIGLTLFAWPNALWWARGGAGIFPAMPRHEIMDVLAREIARATARIAAMRDLIQLRRALGFDTAAAQALLETMQANQARRIARRRLLERSSAR